MPRQGSQPIHSRQDIVPLCLLVRTLATDLGFRPTAVTRLTTATAELVRNIVLYAGTGVLQWRVLREKRRLGIELTFADHGPGIPNIEEAMQEGYSTGGGLGLGLPGTKRLMDAFAIASQVGTGTQVIVRLYRGL